MDFLCSEISYSRFTTVCDPFLCVSDDLCTFARISRKIATITIRVFGIPLHGCGFPLLLGSSHFLHLLGMGCEFPHSTKFTFRAPSLHVVNFHILVFHISWIFFTCCEFHISWIFFTCCPIASSEVLCLLQTRSLTGCFDLFVLYVFVPVR